MKYKQLFCEHRYLVCLVGLYLITRLTFLTVLPIFTDESIYIYWAKFISTFKTQWFLPLTDGKPPLFVWMISLALTILPSDAYLLAGRLVSIIMGLACLVGMYFICLKLFKSKSIGIIAVFLYIITPYTFFYDRMALFDTPLSAALTWSVYLSLITAEKPNPKNTLIWSAVTGIAFYMKPTALLYWMLEPLIFLIWLSENRQSNHKLRSGQILIILLSELAISQLFYQSLRVSSAYPAFVRKNSQFSFGLTELLRNPVLHLLPNLKTVISWLKDWLTVEIWIMTMAGFSLMYRNFRSQFTILILLISVPIVSLSAIGKEIFPRYFLFTAPYVLIGAAFFLDSFKLVSSKPTKILFGIGILLAAINIVSFSAKVWFTPANAQMPLTDYEQYIQGHPSGYGIGETVQKLNQIIKNHQHISLVTEGTFGLYPYAFNLSYWNNPKITIFPKWPLVIDQSIINLQQSGPVYIVLKEYETIPSDWPVDTVLISPKPGKGKYPVILVLLRPTAGAVH